MKKLIALLLVICVVFGLAACGGKKTDDTAKDPTGGSANADPSTPSLPNPDGPDGPDDPQPTDSPYKGKTIEIYGLGTQDSYTDYTQFGKGNYVWMERAAIDEWAAMNGVTVIYKGSYNQSGILADMSSGGKPDLIFQSNHYPSLANVGLAAAFTEAEYNKLAEICGKEYLDMMTYGTSKVGLVRPWTGTMMCYYNKTMFEDYGVKTPKEYFLEGNWTWETFMKCMEETTKDVDADGTMDTYGLNGDSWGNLINPWAQDENGKLISTIDEPWLQDFYQLKYDAFTVKKVSIGGKSAIQKNVIYPMFAMQLSDCEPYNFEHLYQEIPNGNELEVVPVPEWRGDNGETLGTSKLTQSAIHMAATCDEREAAVDLLCYLLKCGLKYISDFSLGSVPCEYAGIQGTCETSANWKTAFAKVIADRNKDIKKIDSYDAEYVTKLNEYLNGRGHYIFGEYTKVTILTGFSEITKLPPESSIPAIKSKYQAMLDVYNNTYIK